MKVQIHPSWEKVLSEEFQKPYFAQIKERLLQEKKQFGSIYPNGKNIFHAFNRTPFERVKVVLLGQDPYHGPNQAHGLSFSVPKGVKIPPSLRNIYKELSEDLGIPIPDHGNLEAWADQGVLLLNSMLTVRANQPASHRQFGWELFTDAVIQNISEKQQHVVFILWGNFAKGKQSLINSTRHLIITSPHPSPFSAHTGFFGSKPFSKTNQYLESKGKQTIQWEL